jgi:hypothetical protein
MLVVMIVVMMIVVMVVAVTVVVAPVMAVTAEVNHDRRSLMVTDTVSMTPMAAAVDLLDDARLAPAFNSGQGACRGSAADGKAKSS